MHTGRDFCAMWNCQGFCVSSVVQHHKLAYLLPKLTCDRVQCGGISDMCDKDLENVTFAT